MYSNFIYHFSQIPLYAFVNPASLILTLSYLYVNSIMSYISQIPSIYQPSHPLLLRVAIQFFFKFQYIPVHIPVMIQFSSISLQQNTSTFQYTHIRYSSTFQYKKISCWILLGLHIPHGNVPSILFTIISSVTIQGRHCVTTFYDNLVHEMRTSMNGKKWQINYLPWLEKILKFTSLKWPNIAFKLSTMVGENFEFYLSQMT